MAISKEFIAAEVERLRAIHGHCSWERLAREIGVTSDSVRRAVDPGYAERRNAQLHARRMAERPATAKRINRVPDTSPELRRDAASRIAEIPKDTRSVTGRILGDPLPGRSALDRRGNV